MRTAISVALLVVTLALAFWWSRAHPSRGADPTPAIGGQGEVRAAAGAMRSGPATGGRTPDQIDAGRRRHGDLERQTPLDREYIQKQVAELAPLLKECYQLALASDPLQFATH